ncbi:cysteine-rich motor neuron 1 protein-like isoform X2 [Puntigrus tetrazona]|uniref:cysteine-rich motor neuron 1 protein-like isoform X2 n=1 Tax=Puntigrus tetrazona TaxID=1606681 RepID=UPI001C8A1494|nr:cysteine-rich motor neuron 1 protein-like isoform X2 [Puntigrus tetrazona]
MRHRSCPWFLGALLLGFCARAAGAPECENCSRSELEPCGGPDWILGSCGSGLACAALNGTGPARAPETGVCREDPQCAGVTCAPLPVPVCPSDSALSRSYPPPAGCCPTLPPQCACERCPAPPACRDGRRAVLLTEGSGAPGNCCNTYICQRVSPRCVHDGKEFAEGEVYRMDPCWLCQCRGGVSFCSKAECAELDCDNFYVPEGECCPVCIDVELLSVESTKASCWVNHRLRAHEEQWKEDDCTFCQCVDGEPHCTAMACKQSCQNPVKIPGECCPFCEEPSYETVSPLLCPPLENCSLSGHDCPFGFQQDPSGCLLCQCVSNETCPDVSTLCSLECPLGYEKDSYGCEVCECSVSTPKCRPMTCSKTCPYGYMRNKHGCEMCRCVRCPPFSCDKLCSHGYKKSRKGCGVCECKDADRRVSSTSASVTVSSGSCLTASGRRFLEGDGWHDGCRDCFCHAGREMCVLITCPVPSCVQPVLRADQCCPSCDDEAGSGQPEGPDLVVCRAPAGELYVEGETWRLDECTSCTCRQGRVLCESESCPPLLCHTPVRSRDSCCYTCSEEDLESLNPFNSSLQESCESSSGEILRSGDSWKPNACSSCVCLSGSVRCFSQQCPLAACRVPVLRKGQCCPQCMLEITSSSSPVTESRLTSAPPRAVTDGDGLLWDVPSQTEMTLIYQSAAWILAGILLAVVIFLLVAVLVNRRKNWVQMSCYGAPKKTVILQKHVNKSSLVYMEPSRENQFQSVKSESVSNGERVCIPRAKLAGAHVQR